MKRIFSTKVLASLALTGAVLAVLAGSSQEAKADTKIYLGFGNPAPVVYAQPRVVYAQPQPVYYRSAPVYRAPVQYVTYYPAYNDRRGWSNGHNHHDDRNHGRGNGHRNWR